MKKYLYIMTSPSYANGVNVKVGVSNDPDKRLVSLRSTHDHLLKIFIVFKTKNAVKIEAAVKNEFKDFRRKGAEFFYLENTIAITSFIEKFIGGENV